MVSSHVVMWRGLRFGSNKHNLITKQVIVCSSHGGRAGWSQVIILSFLTINILKLTEGILL